MNTDAKRYYAVLGVDSGASEEAIRGAFRRRAKELHPDKQSGDAGAFILLKRAYDTLIDPDHRAAYDQACQPPPRPPPPRYEPGDAYRPQVHRSTPPLPPLDRSKNSRYGGGIIVRYVIAFLIMAAISLGGVQAMISLTEAPPSIQTRSTPARADRSSETSSTAAPVAEAPTAPGSSTSGFWDASPPAAKKKNAE